MPESLPAAFESLKKDKVNKLERSLIIDLGGTTLDCGLILSAFEGISEIRGYSEIRDITHHSYRHERTDESLHTLQLFYC